MTRSMVRVHVHPPNEYNYYEIMITTAHVLIGGAIGAATQNPLLALTLGTASHFIADMVPHLDVPPSAKRDKNNKLIFTPQIWTQVLVDGAVAIALVTYFWVLRGEF